MLERQDIEDIFQMYFMGMTLNEINKKFQECGVGTKGGKPFQEYKVPQIVVIHILESSAVVGKEVITKEMFDMVRKLLELDRLNDENIIKLSRMEQIYTVLDWRG